MKSRKILTVLIAATFVFSSTASAFACETKPTSKDNKQATSSNYIKGGNFDKKLGLEKLASTIKNCNLDKTVTAAKPVSAPKVEAPEKDNASSKDYNLGKDVNIGTAVRDAQAKAKLAPPVVVTPPVVTPPVVSQELKDQIKAEYTAMRATELTSKATFVGAVNKKNQVMNYIHQVAEGKLTYTDAQLTQLDTLSVTFTADIKAVADATALIKTDEAAVEASGKSENYDAVLAGLKVEAAARTARGTTLTKVSQDLDAFLLVLVEGTVVAPVAPATPATPVVPAA